MRPESGGGEDVAIRTLEPVGREAFLAWRAGDEYMRVAVAAGIADHEAGARRILVAWLGDRPVGTISLVFRHEDPELADGHACAYLEALEVEAGLRRQGLGTRLCLAALRLAAETGRRRVTVAVEPDNAAALTLYLGLGLRLFKDSTWFWRGVAHPVQCLARDLGSAVP